jgi:hypothetical protein
VGAPVTSLPVGLFPKKPETDVEILIRYDHQCSHEGCTNNVELGGVKVVDVEGRRLPRCPAHHPSRLRVGSSPLPTPAPSVVSDPHPPAHLTPQEGTGQYQGDGAPPTTSGV